MTNQAHELDAAVVAFSDRDGQPQTVDPWNPLPVHETRKVHGFTKQVALSATPVRIAGANPARKSIKITNVTGTLACLIGFEGSANLPTQGDFLAASAGSNIVTDACNEIWGVSTAAQTVSVLEEEFTL